MKDRDHGSKIRDQFEAAPPGVLSEDDADFDSEIARRVAEVEAGTAKTLSREEFKASMRSTLGK